MSGNSVIVNQQDPTSTIPPQAASSFGRSLEQIQCPQTLDAVSPTMPQREKFRRQKDKWEDRFLGQVKAVMEQRGCPTLGLKVVPIPATDQSEDLRKLQRFSVCGFRIVDESAFDDSDFSRYDICWVFLAKAANDRGQLIPIIVLPDENSDVGAETRDVIYSDLTQKLGCHPLDLVKQPTANRMADVFGKALKGKLLPLAIGGLAAISLTLARTTALPSLHTAHEARQEQKSQQTKETLDSLEDFCSRMSKEPDLQKKLDMTNWFFSQNSTKYGNSLNSLLDAFHSKDPAMRLQAIRIIGRLCSIEIQHEKTFSDGPSFHTFSLRTELLTQAKEDPDENIRLESLKAIRSIESAEIEKHGRLLGSKGSEYFGAYGGTTLSDTLHDIAISGKTQEDRDLAVQIMELIAPVSK